MTTFIGGWPNVNLLALPAASGGFTIPTPPTPSTGSTSVYVPNFTTGPTGKDPFRAWNECIVDGIECFANGWDQPWRWDEGSNFYPLGSTAPTTFALALSAAGAPASLPTGQMAFYYLVFAVSALGKETAPQYTAGVLGVSIANSTGGTRDVTVTWTDPGGEYDKARIYRRLQGTDDFRLVAEVTASTATYLDATTDATLAALPVVVPNIYVTTYRATLPPIFLSMFQHGNRLWGFTGEDPSLYYAQIARTDARFVADDFPDANQLPLEPNDGCGTVRAAWSHNGFLYAFKERGSFQVEGDDPTNFVVSRMFAGRGCLGPKTLIEMDNGNLVILDALGIYEWTPGADPTPKGVNAKGISRLAPIFARMNLGMARWFWIQHFPEQSVLRFWIALDYDPIPSPLVVYDYKKGIIFQDPGLWGTAGAPLEDASGERHYVRACDFGQLHEDEIGNSDGVYAGSLTATLTAGTVLLWTAGAAAFDTTSASGCLGAYVERYDSSGNVIDQNRVAAITSTTIAPYWWDATTPTTTDTVAVGAIPAVARSGKKDFDSAQMKHVTGATIEHDVEASSSYTLSFMSAMDEDAFARPPNITEIDLSGGEGHTTIAISDRGFDWSWQLSQRYAGVDFVVWALNVQFHQTGTSR